MVQMGRFTLRDEGRTIAVGKVLRYKPAKADVAGLTAQAASKEEQKVGGAAGTTSQTKEELVFDMDTGETVTREEYNKRQKGRNES
jgi:putative aminopeptidase FrvX